MNEMRRVFLDAAARIQANGHFNGDYYPNACTIPETAWPFDRRPLSVYGAISFAVSGGPRLAFEGAAADALLFAAERLSDWASIGGETDAVFALQSWEREQEIGRDAAVRALLELADMVPAVAA